MIWRRPRWAVRLQPRPVGDLLTEAHALGIVGRGAITGPARSWWRATDGAVDAMAKVLPEPIDHFLLQADLTVIVPGPLERELGEQLAAVATVESAGAAMVYRISEPSIRRALDTGRTAGELHALFAETLQNSCAARPDIPHRRRRPQAWAAAGRYGRVVRAMRGPRVAGSGRRRARRRAAGDAAARADRRGVAGADLGGARRRCAPRASHPQPRIPPARSSTSGPGAPGCPSPRIAARSRPSTPPAGQTLSAIVAVLRKVAATPFANCASIRRWRFRSCRRRRGCRTRS